MTAAVVLAAGAARRFGSPKQLAVLHGEPLVARACGVALAAELHPVAVVLGAHAEQVAAALPRDQVVPLFNPRWNQGLATSLRRGLDYLARHAGDDDFAVLLADQPLIEAEHVRALVALRRDTEAPHRRNPLSRRPVRRTRGVRTQPARPTPTAVRRPRRRLGDPKLQTGRHLTLFRGGHGHRHPGGSGALLRFRAPLGESGMCVRRFSHSEPAQFC